MSAHKLIKVTPSAITFCGSRKNLLFDNLFILYKLLALNDCVHFTGGSIDVNAGNSATFPKILNSCHSLVHKS